MLTRRGGLAVPPVVAAAVVLACSGVAAADGGLGGVDCRQNPSAPQCDITAGTPGDPGQPAGSSNDGSGGSDDGATGQKDPCHWAPVEGQRPPPAGKGPAGGWYAWTCAGDGFGSQRTPVWLDQAPGVDLAAMAQMARSRLVLPTPQIRTSPDRVPFVLVRVPVWLWVDPLTWGPRSATAAVPGVTVTATATPVRVRWSFGDNTADLTCAGPGKPWAPGTDPRTASSCGHTYTRSSASTRDEAFVLRATVTWTVTWSGPGGGGTLAALTTTSAAPVRVAQSQSIVGSTR
ncbi:hypothetical protein ACGFIE_00370 [Micromonospora sp. NPDC049275]|uniref:hypothetical protein n=1 Tax=Micromonospora sp. NPDC049275 TaxID=3364268 RepID=UPI003710AFD6